VKRRLIDDRTAREYTVEILQDVEARLRAGARGSGVTLTADECQKLLAAGIKPLPRPKGRPPIADRRGLVAQARHCKGVSRARGPRRVGEIRRDRDREGFRSFNLGGVRGAQNHSPVQINPGIFLNRFLLTL